MAPMINCPFQICIALLMAILVAGASAATNRLAHAQNLQPDQQPPLLSHREWMAKHGRVYSDAAEEERRAKIFKQNVELIESSNRNGSLTYKLGLNKFSDLTNEEFQEHYIGKLLLPLDVPPTSFKYQNSTDVPPSMDWRDKGAVTGVKNQGRCGSCWAFAGVAAMEGIMQISNNGKLVPLSEQQIIDCDSNDHGCMGGRANGAYEFVMGNKGVTSEESYPYKGVQGSCDQSATPVASISGYEAVPKNDEQSLMQAVAKQPVSIVIDASGDAFMSYKSGVFNGPCEENLNHAVTVVGYGTDNATGMSYWLVRNSWGKDWGDGGYIRMQKDDVENHPSGMCGLAMMPLYPTV